MMPCFYDDGLQFSCTRCSACCRFSSGYVFLSKNDIMRASAHLGISEEEFLTQYCRQVDLGHEIRVSLTEKENFDCIFWSQEKDGCSIYEGRPLQCQSYPFWPQLLNEKAWQAEKQHCPGIGSGKVYRKEEIDKIQELRRQDPLICLKNKDQDKNL